MAIKMAMDWKVWLAASLLLLVQDSRAIIDTKCEPIKVEFCTKLGYNMTGMPNMLGHQVQVDALSSLITFYPLMVYNCAPELLFFLCSVHVPMCTQLPPSSPGNENLQTQLIGPCRPMCERVRDKCLPVLELFKLSWPLNLACEKFPRSNKDDNMCMDGGGKATDSPPSGTSAQQAFNAAGLDTLQAINPRLLEQAKELSKDASKLNKLDPYLKMFLESNMYKNIKPAKGYSGTCSDLKYSVNYHYVNRTDECVPKCGVDIIFDAEDKKFAEVWVSVWSILCFITSLFTLITYILDTSRFKYPERCIIFVNLSYHILSIGYILRLIFGSELTACTHTQGEPSLLVRQGLTPTPYCTVVYLIIYFSSLAGSVWWAITTVTWSLLLFTNMDSKRMEGHSPMMHLVGWGVPAVQTIVVLLLYQIEGDELTGICLPGQQTEQGLLNFLIIPFSFYLGSASFFFLSGVVGSLVNPGEESRKLLARIGLFSIFYTIPQVCVLASMVYEWIERPSWRSLSSTSSIVEMFMLRISMWLVVGIISGAWILSHRTISVWKQFLTSCSWNQSKPSTPVFPKVAYRPAPTSSQSKETALTMKNIGKLSSEARSSTPHGLPYTVENNKITI
eukprot:TRINITY_DN8725_c0_g2_i4.p1 TRINITY_DN8725_c0_g2~~TRINITY_DN8725_c0_g2_i4.p1  ORF type:complete len:618 (+),score=97.25 TRINITY_DN8725_c0_g2_i4:72-1925(+)